MTRLLVDALAFLEDQSTTRDIAYNLIDLCRDGQLLPWSLLATIGIGPDLLEPHELMLVRRESSPQPQQISKSHRGLFPLDLLDRIAARFSAREYIDAAIGGCESVETVATALEEFLDGLPD